MVCNTNELLIKGRLSPCKSKKRLTKQTMHFTRHTGIGPMSSDGQSPMLPLHQCPYRLGLEVVGDNSSRLIYISFFQCFCSLGWRSFSHQWKTMPLVQPSLAITFWANPQQVGWSNLTLDDDDHSLDVSIMVKALLPLLKKSFSDWALCCQLAFLLLFKQQNDVGFPIMPTNYV